MYVSKGCHVLCIHIKSILHTTINYVKIRFYSIYSIHTVYYTTVLYYTTLYYTLLTRVELVVGTVPPHIAGGQGQRRIAA